MGERGVSGIGGSSTKEPVGEAGVSGMVVSPSLSRRTALEVAVGAGAGADPQATVSSSL